MGGIRRVTKYVDCPRCKACRAIEEAEGRNRRGSFWGLLMGVVVGKIGVDRERGEGAKEWGGWK